MSCYHASLTSAVCLRVGACTQIAQADLERLQTEADRALEARRRAAERERAAASMLAAASRAKSSASHNVSLATRQHLVKVRAVVVSGGSMPGYVSPREMAQERESEALVLQQAEELRLLQSRLAEVRVVMGSASGVEPGSLQANVTGGGGCYVALHAVQATARADAAEDELGHLTRERRNMQRKLIQ